LYGVLLHDFPNSLLGEVGWHLGQLLISCTSWYYDLMYSYYPWLYIDRNWLVWMYSKQYGIKKNNRFQWWLSSC